MATARTECLSLDMTIGSASSLVRSQALTVPSALAAISVLPSGPEATDLIQSSYPYTIVGVSSDIPGSQTWMAPKPEANSRSPSEFICDRSHNAFMARQYYWQGINIERIPKMDSRITPSRGELSPIRAESNRPNNFPVTRQDDWFGVWVRKAPKKDCRKSGLRRVAVRLDCTQQTTLRLRGWKGRWD